MPAVVVFTAPDPPTPTLLLLLLFPIRRLALLPTDRQIDLTFEKEKEKRMWDFRVIQSQQFLDVRCSLPPSVVEWMNSWSDKRVKAVV